MQCIYNRKLAVSERRPTQVQATSSVREPRPVLKTDYVRKIAADACMVGSLPTPQSSRVPPGIIRPTESHNCTYTTNSGFGGMRIYPYSDYRACDCAAELRRSRAPSKHPAHCCACVSAASTLIHALPPQAPLPRQSISVTAVPRQHSQVHARHTSVGATTAVTNGVVLRQHIHPLPPHPHSHHLSRRDRTLLATSMLVNPPNASQKQHMQNQPHAMVPIYHPHLYRQSMPPAVNATHQHFQIAPPNVYAAVVKEVHIQ
ncbi:hypothetical protein Aperf_G00000011411 [Anoplocephala perfoliata]